MSENVSLILYIIIVIHNHVTSTVQYSSLSP